jgi:hypothetical protein
VSPVGGPTEPSAESTRTTTPDNTEQDAFVSQLDRLDRVATLIGWGLPIIGVLAATRSLLEASEHAASAAGGWLAYLLGAISMIGIFVLAGLGVSSVLRVLVHWLSLDRQPLGILEIRKTIRAGKWEEAAALLDGYSATGLADPRLSALRAEIRSARDAVRSKQLAQLKAAQQANDPERVLELHQSLLQVLDPEIQSALDSELSQWFLRLVHNRLRSGKIQADLAVLAGRIAEAFGHTVEGASLRASLPTLRRSAGLCSRCGQPYGGMGSACPTCLAQAQSTSTPPAPPTP